jgi:hypothetical protein
MDSWQQISFSLVWVLFPLGMFWRYVSRKTNGLVMLLMYNALILPDVPINKVSNNKLWKLKIPLQIKVF